MHAIGLRNTWLIPSLDTVILFVSAIFDHLKSMICSSKGRFCDSRHFTLYFIQYMTHTNNIYFGHEIYVLDNVQFMNILNCSQKFGTQNSFNPATLIEVPVQSKKNDQSYICEFSSSYDVSIVLLNCFSSVVRVVFELIQIYI